MICSIRTTSQAQVFSQFITLAEPTILHDAAVFLKLSPVQDCNVEFSQNGIKISTRKKGKWCISEWSLGLSLDSQRDSLSLPHTHYRHYFTWEWKSALDHCFPWTLHVCTSSTLMISTLSCSIYVTRRAFHFQIKVVKMENHYMIIYIFKVPGDTLIHNNDSTWSIATFSYSLNSKSLGPDKKSGKYLKQNETGFSITVKGNTEVKSTELTRTKSKVAHQEGI